MFAIISIQLVKMFLLILVGFVLQRTGSVPEGGDKALSNVLLYVVNPCVIINSFTMDYTQELMHGLLIALVLAVLSHIIAIIIGKVIIRKKGNHDYNVECFSVVYCNCGFMGIPLINSILGSEGVFYLTAYMAVFNIFAWTHGLILMTGNTSGRQLRKGLLSPVMFAIVIGLMIFLGRIPVPDIPRDVISYLADMNTGMGMLIAGIALAQADLLRAFGNRRMYLVCAGRQILAPLVTLLLLLLLPVSNTIRYCVLIASACPVGTTGVMFAIKYDKNYRYASELFTFSTLLCLVTLPMIVLIAEQVMG